MASLPRRPKGLIQREAIDLPTTAPPLYSTKPSQSDERGVMGDLKNDASSLSQACCD
jgi:hypothetical protein